MAFPNSSLTIPLGINAAGKIVGQYVDAAGNAHSFLAEPRAGNNNGVDAVTNGSAVQSGGAASQPAPVRICESAEWRQHPEQIRNLASCQIRH